jgi:hypothetical protein
MILENVDNPYELWVTCRQLFSELRHEAERVFRRRLLPRLRIAWHFACAGVEGDESLDVRATFDTVLDDPGFSTVSLLSICTASTIRWMLYRHFQGTS